MSLCFKKRATEQAPFLRGLWKHGGTEVTEPSLCLCDSVFQKNRSVPADYDCIKQWRLAIEIPLTIAPTIPTKP